MIFIKILLLLLFFIHGTALTAKVISLQQKLKKLLS